jgi:ferric-dicitrate binding protein FerR (iron transport regulator)
MKSDTLKNLLNKYLENKADAGEHAALDEWYDSFDEEEGFVEQLTESEKSIYEARMLNKINEQLFEKDKVKPLFKIKRLRSISIAASFLVFLLTAAYFIVHKKDKQPVTDQFAGIVPGGDNATLTLADGSTIVLNSSKNGLITQQGNAAIMKADKGHIYYNDQHHLSNNSIAIYNTVRTPRGGKYVLTLADGTRIWLNAESAVTFPTTFSGKERNVSMGGEVYFEVAKNKKMPFHVISGDQTIEVLGTHFNVNAYHDENAVRTTLLEGKVKIKRGLRTAILMPGQQSVIESSNTAISVTDADTTHEVAWKNGLFSFQNADIKAIMSQIAKWYNVKVEYAGTMTDRRFYGTINRQSSINELLKILSLEKIHFLVKEPVTAGGEKTLEFLP